MGSGQEPQAFSRYFTSPEDSSEDKLASGEIWKVHANPALTGEKAEFAGLLANPVTKAL